VKSRERGPMHGKAGGEVSGRTRKGKRGGDLTSSLSRSIAQVQVGADRKLEDDTGAGENSPT